MELFRLTFELRTVQKQIHEKIAKSVLIYYNNPMKQTKGLSKNLPIENWKSLLLDEKSKEKMNIYGSLHHFMGERRRTLAATILLEFALVDLNFHGTSKSPKSYSSYRFRYVDFLERIVHIFSHHL